MTRRKRRNRSASFNSKVALSAIHGDRAMAELAEHFDVQSNQLQDWKKKLLASAEEVFANGSSSGAGPRGHLSAAAMSLSLSAMAR